MPYQEKKEGWKLLYFALRAYQLKFAMVELVKMMRDIASGILHLHCEGVIHVGYSASWFSAVIYGSIEGYRHS